MFKQFFHACRNVQIRLFMFVTTQKEQKKTYLFSKVYLLLQKRKFSPNLSKADKTHMDAVFRLLEYCGVSRKKMEANKLYLIH